jgi:ribonuclease J
VINRGFVFEEAADHILEEARHRTLLTLKESAVEQVADPTILREHIRVALRRYFFEATQRKPVIVPVIMEV